MPLIHFNKNLNFADNIIWSAKNGAKRRHLQLINKVISSENINTVNAKIGVLDKGNHSFIFLNEPRPNDERILGIFLNSGYGYSIISGTEIFTNSSVGGYGNSESKFGVYEPGTILEVHTYKHRRPSTYFKLTLNGWITVCNHIIDEKEQILI